MLDNRWKSPKEPFAAELERYLSDTLHERISVLETEHERGLPAFLARAYTVYEACIAGRKCIFLAAFDSVGTPSDIAKHINLVRDSVDAIVALATPSMSAHNRSRLIGQGVPFVVPGNQLYIPDLAMDLREHFRALKRQNTNGLSPVAQAVLFDHLLRPHKSVTTPSLIADRLRYSAMSIGRAFDDLVASGLAGTEKQGKERHLQFKAEGRQLFEEAQNLLRSPVRAVKFVRGDHAGSKLKRAGESALAELTDLSLPRISTFAVAASDWKSIAHSSNFTVINDDQADIIVETWSYDPASLSDAPIVDPLSLYAQFRAHRDERVALAAEHLLEFIPW